MGRLVTFGCSYTHGHGLEKFDKTNVFPQGKTWGSVLSKKLKLLFHNLALPGSSNRKIWHTVLKADLDSKDTVVILWTHPERTCMFTLNCDLQQVEFDDGTWHKKLTTTDIGPWTNSPVSKAYIQHFSGLYNQLVDLNLYMSYISNYLDNKGIKNYHALALKNKQDEEFIKTDYNNARVLTTNFQSCWCDMGYDKKHPGKQSHKKFAQEIYKEIKEMEAMNEDQRH